MISVVICSRDAVLLSTVSRNINQTIGVPYEVIGIDNSEGKYGICEVYNEGAAQSKYSIVCFMHEDIAFHTPNWGQTVVEIFADDKIGVLGVAGGTYIADAPGSWNSCGSEYIVMQIQHTVNVNTKLDRLVPEQGNIFPVAAVDGVWMCCCKAVWQESPFDAITFPGFHFYDIDFCTRIFPTHQICVTTAVLIEHFSRGSYTEPWYKAAITYHSCRRTYLPFGIVKTSAVRAKQLKVYALQQFILGYMKHGLPTAVALRLFRECLLTNPFNRDTIWVIRKWLRNSISSQNA